MLAGKDWKDFQSCSCCFSMGQIMELWSKTAESQLKEVIYGLRPEFAQLSFLPRYFRDSQLSLRIVQAHCVAG
jgi:hypothetical protein